MSLTFAINWDYRCPFARNVHEHVLAGLAAGAQWDVTFVAFSLGQSHVEEGDPSVWEAPETDSGLLALQVGVVVRNTLPDAFLAFHKAMFAARHDEGRRIENPSVIADVLQKVGVNAAAVLGEVETGAALRVVQQEHESYVHSHDVWGVPTFISGAHAAFVRLMDRPTNDLDASVAQIEKIVDLLDTWPSLNEFKHTSLAR